MITSVPVSYIIAKTAKENAIPYDLLRMFLWDNRFLGEFEDVIQKYDLYPYIRPEPQQSQKLLPLGSE